MSELNDHKRIGASPETHQIGAHKAPELIEEHYTEPEAAPVADDIPAASAGRSFLGSGAAWILVLATIVVAGLLLLATHGGHTEYERTAANTSDFYMGPTKVTKAGTPVTPDMRVAAVFASSPKAAATAMGRTTAASTAAAAADDGADIPVVVYLFNYDSNNVPENKALTELAADLSASGRDVAIVAYTDPHGSVAYNQRLSERRARAIGDYLAAHGVDRKHITASGAGPTTAYATPALDRRAVITAR